MDSAAVIRNCVSRVQGLRQALAADPGVGASVHSMKCFQAKRFRGSYADFLAGGPHSQAAQFFLDELYGTDDYAERDAQFAYIAGAMQRLFPESVVMLAVRLAELHALTEELDDRIGRAAVAFPELDEFARYVAAWRVVGCRKERHAQLANVMKIGEDLARLTRVPGLRMMLRMMRAPASAAGLGSLQGFLERGFDTFALLVRAGQLETFLGAIRDRESLMIESLFSEEHVTCETRLRNILGQVR